MITWATFWTYVQLHRRPLTHEDMWGILISIVMAAGLLWFVWEDE